jgi:hypothetical protein
MVMTLEQKYDRWERIAKLLYEDSIRARRESRKQTAKLRSYAAAAQEYELASLAVDANPEDSEMKEALNKAREVLRQAIEQLRR